MKQRNILPSVRQFRRLMTLPTVCIFALLAASCSEQADDKGTTLPDGAYPMIFTTTVEGLTATRAATADGQWTTGDLIALQVDNEVKQYTPTSISGNSATLSAVSGSTPFYWQNTNNISVSAWYYGTGYDATPPTSTSWTWTVQSDQSKSEPGTDNYQRSDFLYAPATSIAFNSSTGGTANSLAFHHQTAKVIINIKNAEAATEAAAIQSVVIGHDNNLALSGSYTAPTGTATAGTWNTTGGTPTMGTITPKDITDGNSYLKTYAALVIPQQMQDKKFIAVTLSNGNGGSNTYYYTPKNNDANLQSGKQHTYDITVKYGSLEVTASTSPQWTGSDETVTGTEKSSAP